MLPVSTADTCKVVLSEHAAMENPPTFLFRFLNGHQQRELLQVKADMDKGDELEKFDAMFAAVESHLVGWENIDIEYGKGKLSEVIGWNEVISLLARLVYQRPCVADKKKCKSPSPLDMENSAKTAPEAPNASEPLTTPTAGDSTE